MIFPFESWHNHSSSIVELPSGDLFVCWFHGSGESNADDVKILGARKRKGEAQWSTPFLMADTPDYPDTNCAMFIDPQGRLWDLSGMVPVKAGDWFMATYGFDLNNRHQLMVYGEGGPDGAASSSVMLSIPASLRE